MPRRTKLTDFKPMQDEVLRLREENARLRQRVEDLEEMYTSLGRNYDMLEERAESAEARVSGGHGVGLVELYLGRAEAAEKRVEELERQRVEGVVALCVCENAATPRPGCDCVTCTVRRADQRAEAAQARVDELEREVEALTLQRSGADNAILAAEAKLARVVEAGELLLEAYGEAHELYDLGDCEGSVKMRAALDAAKGEK